MKLWHRRSGSGAEREDPDELGRAAAEGGPQPQPEREEPTEADPGLFDLSKRDYLAIIQRAGKEMKVAVGLQLAPETPREEITIQSRSPFLGIKAANISPAVADELRLDATASGVAITEVSQGSIAQNLGFQKGDVFVSVNNTRIETTRDLDRATREQS